MGDIKKKHDFSNFANKLKPTLKVERYAPVTSYYRGGRWTNYDTDPVREFTLEEIEEILRSGDLQSLRELSRYFYRTNSEYRNNIDFLTCLPLYDTVVIPILKDGEGSKAQIIKTFDSACRFIENLDVPNTFSRITREWLKTGIYNGIMRVSGEHATIQDLPLEYCRTRFKDFNNLNILEFNIYYFLRFPTEEEREALVATFPKEIQDAWALYKKNLLTDPWVLLPAASGGVCFTHVGDQTPLLIASIPALKKLNDAVAREEKRDENELYKLLIQQMPTDSDGQLVFELDEVADIHASIAQMLKDIDTVDVLTTFGNTKLESLQENSAASQSADRIAKYKTNAWDALGRGSILFNAEGSGSLAYEIKKDESLMINYLNAYETWIKYHLNERYARNGLTFDFEMLPTTVFNRQELQQNYFRGAQYGYSKMFAGVAMGIKQRDQISLMEFENEYLDMSQKMIPLQSSYTTSGTAIAAEEKNNNSSAQKTTIRQTINDIDNKGGRPELPDEQKSEKTQANIAANG